MGKKNMSRAGRKEAIAKAFIAHQISSGKIMMTVAQVARKMGLEPSTHLRKIMIEMKTDGLLESMKIDDPTEINGFKVLYTLTKKGRRWQEPTPRKIVINGQASLWSDVLG